MHECMCVLCNVQTGKMLRVEHPCPVSTAQLRDCTSLCKCKLQCHADQSQRLLREGSVEISQQHLGCSVHLFLNGTVCLLFRFLFFIFFFSGLVPSS